MTETNTPSMPALLGLAALVAALATTGCGAPGSIGAPGEPGSVGARAAAGSGGAGGAPEDPGTTSSGTAPPEDGAAALFWKAFHDGDHAAIPEVRQALDEEMATSPNPYATFLRAHVDLWELMEVALDGDDVGATARLALAALDNFERAKEDNPQDTRLHAWHGLLVSAVGQATANPLMYESGIDEIELAVPSGAPTIVGAFTLMSVLSRNPPLDPHFAAGVEATWATVELCAGGPVDRQNPDMTGLSIDGMCHNHTITPHSWQGFWLSAGDVLAKAGERDVAETMYRNAKVGDGFAGWLYAPDLEQRLVDLDARIAAYQDVDPFNDPPIGGSNLCHGCHTNDAGK
jgi:hypothetical protein